MNIRKFIIITLVIINILALTACSGTEKQAIEIIPDEGKVEGIEIQSVAESPDQDFFNAKVIEVTDAVILAECTESKSGSIPAGSEVSISTNTISSEEVPILSVGDNIRVVYIGDVMESYPLQLQEVRSIFWIDENGEIVTEPVKKEIEVKENPDWGITLSAEEVTSAGLTVVCSQTGGNPSGELQTGSWYTLEKLTEEGWRTVEYLPQEYEIGWTMEAYLIPMESALELDVNWEWLYGQLPAGKYRIGKEIMDFRGSGDYDKSVIYAEFEITE